VSFLHEEGTSRADYTYSLIWIHGGSYQNVSPAYLQSLDSPNQFQGYSALPFYNMSYMVNESVAMGKPIIGVSINYRLAFFGFLASTEILVCRVKVMSLRTSADILPELRQHQLGLERPKTSF